MVVLSFCVVERKIDIYLPDKSFPSKSENFAINGTSKVWWQSEHFHVWFSFSVRLMNVDWQRGHTSKMSFCRVIDPSPMLITHFSLINASLWTWSTAVLYIRAEIFCSLERFLRLFLIWFQCMFAIARSIGIIYFFGIKLTGQLYGENWPGHFWYTIDW